jgi:hypothetical protein
MQISCRPHAYAYHSTKYAGLTSLRAHPHVHNQYQLPPVLSATAHVCKAVCTKQKRCTHTPVHSMSRCLEFVQIWFGDHASTSYIGIYPQHVLLPPHHEHCYFPTACLSVRSSACCALHRITNASFSLIRSLMRSWDSCLIVSNLLVASA